MKVHLSLPVRDLAATRAFYEVLFDAPPVKVKADYIKFDPERPALNISFVPSPSNEKPRTEQHMGIQFSSRAELNEAFDRLDGANLIRGSRESGTCCYAEQDKFWVRDPDGYEWELYYLLADSEVKRTETNCCAAEPNSTTCCG